MELLISASPGFWHMVALAEETQDRWSAGPCWVSAAAAGAAAIATAAAAAANTGVMTFKPIRMVNPFDSISGCVRGSADHG
jgi:hypothetical protein